MFVQSSGLMNRLFANVCPGRKSRTMSVHLEFFMSESNLQNIFHGKLLASNLKMLKLHIRPEVGGGRERDRKSELEASHPTENQSLPMDIQIWKNIQIDDIIFNFFFFFVAFNLVWVSRKCVDFPDRLNIAEKAGTKKN